MELKRQYNCQLALQSGHCPHTPSHQILLVEASPEVRHSGTAQTTLPTQCSMQMMDSRPELSPVCSTLGLVRQWVLKLTSTLPYSLLPEQMSLISVMLRSGPDLLEGEGAALRSALSALCFFVCLKGSQNCCALVPVRKELSAHKEVT